MAHQTAKPLSKCLVVLAVTAIAAAASAVTTGPASAQPSGPRVPIQDCARLAAASRAPVWEVTFRGERKDLFDHVETTLISGCFRSEAECRVWLYYAQGDWQHNNWTPCRRRG